MRPNRPTPAGSRGGNSRRGISPVLAGACLAAALALTATACGGGQDNASDKPPPSASSSSDWGISIPEDLKDRLKEHGIDLDTWRDGEWKDWDPDKWLREARDFVNPVIEDLWDPDRMRGADEPPAKTVDDRDIAGEDGVTDPAPRPVTATAVKTPYGETVAEAGKLFFDGPEGPMVCSATVVRDPAHPGRSDMVWTAGHCVHAGRSGGWYRNLAFVPSYNENALSAAELENTPREQVAPHGVWWADWAQTSEQWISQGSSTGGLGAPYDFAVLHVTPERGGDATSLEETVGSALPVRFDAPPAPRITGMTASGYPAARPFDGQRLFQCQDRPGRLSLNAHDPAMYRIGCTMTGGASGGGWVANGQDGTAALVSNTSIGPVGAGWLAGPRLGKAARAVYDGVSGKFADR